MKETKLAKDILDEAKKNFMRGKFQEGFKILEDARSEKKAVKNLSLQKCLIKLTTV